MKEAGSASTSPVIRKIVMIPLLEPEAAGHFLSLEEFVKEPSTTGIHEGLF